MGDMDDQDLSELEIMDDSLRTNNSMNDSCVQPDMHPHFIYTATSLYFLIFLLGLVGNLMFCYIVISYKAMQSVTNYFLLNLAIADILISIFCTLNQAILIYTGYFPFGHIFCYLIVLMQPTSVIASSFTLVILSINRYIHILHPLKLEMKTSHTKLVIVGIWMVSALCSSPDVYLAQYTADQGGQCYVNDKVSWSKIYHAVFLVVQYIIPVLIMLYSYSMLVYTIWTRRDRLEGWAETVTKEQGKKTFTMSSRRTHGVAHNGEMEKRKQQMVNSTKKFIKMMVVVVTVYSLCYFPLNIVWLIMESLSKFGEEDAQGYGEIFGYIHTIFLFLALSHACYTPLIYFWMNVQVKHGFIDLFAKIPGIEKCFPNVDWDTPFSRRETLSRHTGIITRQNSTFSTHTSNFRDSHKRQHSRCKDESSIELKELYESEPMMKEVMQNKKKRCPKISVTSILTDISELDLSDSNSSNSRKWSKVSSTALPDIQTLMMGDIIEEEKQSEE